MFLFIFLSTPKKYTKRKSKTDWACRGNELRLQAEFQIINGEESHREGIRVISGKRPIAASKCLS